MPRAAKKPWWHGVRPPRVYSDEELTTMGQTFFRREREQTEKRRRRLEIALAAILTTLHEKLAKLGQPVCERNGCDASGHKPSTARPARG